MKECYMSKNNQNCCEKFKTSIGGQALIEGIMMRGPEKDAIAVRTADGIQLDVKPRTVRKKGTFGTWPLIRGCVNFFDSQVAGVKALMQSADLSPEASDEEPSKVDLWLEEKLGDEKFKKLIVGISVFLGLGLSILLFFMLPMVIGSFFYTVVKSHLLRNLVEGLIRIVIFLTYMFLVSRMKTMKRVFSYHGAEHKTIRCYEAGLPLTVENVRMQTRLHPRCGTSFLLVVMVVSILIFSVASTVLHTIFPNMEAVLGAFLYRVVMVVFKLLLLPLVVSITYEINRWAGRNDNWFTKILTAPGMWLQNFTTNEPDDGMIEVGITAVEAVLPEEAGSDLW